MTLGADATWDQRPVAQAHYVSGETRTVDIYMKSYDFLMLATNVTEKKNNTLMPKKTYV